MKLHTMEDPRSFYSNFGCTLRFTSNSDSRGFEHAQSGVQARDCRYSWPIRSKIARWCTKMYECTHMWCYTDEYAASLKKLFPRPAPGKNLHKTRAIQINMSRWLARWIERLRLVIKVARIHGNGNKRAGGGINTPNDREKLLVLDRYNASIEGWWKPIDHRKIPSSGYQNQLHTVICS